ncbi:phosphoadenosine phosphosulfate reductase family protein (plasmid) [Agrobacterium leguminum]|uniref:phosphoadenosine phosphosulfate reductase domain-containing protein n=1 Tax=Agrobacterium leguminum TaxID=2792015 RepID=UPI0010C9FB7B|nr:phosphoadenosine phosphosulfate reductase family protein [Agrobacterium leguminum]WFS69539.1 phosphoadenosine phosphosulfate reductase family protein [Agrobacterium leguminum]
MDAIATTSHIDMLIADGSPVAIGVSGGKDSQASALATFSHLDRIGHTGPRLLVHADLGSVEWDASPRICRELASYLGVELAVVRRKSGGLMERWEARWQSSLERYQSLSTVTLVPCWSTPAMRFCTSEQKTHVIIAELKRRFPGQRIINVTGVRRDESAARAKATIANADLNGRIWTWRPIVEWSEAEVFAAIDRSGLLPHPAYRHFGMSRVSCRFCIMSSLKDLIAASAQPEAHDLYRRMVALEARSTFAFQGSRWLGDIAPHLLNDAARAAFAHGKAAAFARVQAEARITKPMLYVKGWPQRMLTDQEADLLAEVRQEVSYSLGFASRFLDRESIHARYAELLAANNSTKLAEVA